MASITQTNHTLGKRASLSILVLYENTKLNIKNILLLCSLPTESNTIPTARIRVKIAQLYFIEQPLLLEEPTDNEVEIEL